MKRVLVSLILVIVLSFSLATTIVATGQDNRGCPPPFDLHPIHPHDHHHGEHRHLGSDADRNGDGLICVKHISPDKHVHKDNNNPT